MADENEGKEGFEKTIDDILGIEEPVVVEPAVEPEPAVVAEPVVTEPVVTEPVVVEPVVEPTESVGNSDYYKAQNEALLKRLEEVESRLAKPVEVVKVVEKPKDEISFLNDDDDIDSILNNKEKLNELAVRIYRKAIEDSGKYTSENMQNFVPQAVVEHVQKHLILKEGIDSFFKENSDLLAVRKTVGAITNDVVAEHGDWTLSQILDEAGKRSREVTGIKKRNDANINDNRNPAFAGGNGGRKLVNENVSAVEKQISDLIDI
jgi:hypothetical protein